MQPEPLEALYDENFYVAQVDTSYQSAQVVLGHLWKHCQPKSVLDVGCGRGTWLKAFEELGVTQLIGYDGPWNHQDQMISPAIRFTAIDLNGKFTLPAKVDLVVSLEVAEHLEKTSAETFVHSLTKAADAVLFSAALPGQGGTNHINEQPHSYWAELFQRQGYAAFDLFRLAVWEDENVCWWYRQNVYLYVKNGSPLYSKLSKSGITALPPSPFMDVLHPKKLEIINSAHNLKHASPDLIKVASGQTAIAPVPPPIQTSFMGHVRDLVPSFIRAVKRRLASS